MNQTTATKLFINGEDMSWEEVGVNVKRKIMAYNDNLMLVKVAFNTGGIGAVHQHYHTQITHVESGLFEIEINGEKQTLKSGDSFFIPPNVPHGAVCLEAGVLIDTFSPMREDFLK